MVGITVVIYVFLLTFTKQTRSLQANQTNVCRRKVSSGVQFYCCYNYYETDNECKECSHGTLSTDGIYCKPCKRNFYGYQCQHQCNCQRCDPVHGCINQEHQTYSDLEKSSTDKHGIGKGNTSIPFVVESSFTTASTDSLPIERILYYIIGVAVLIIVTLLSIVVMQILQKNKRQQDLCANINSSEQVFQQNSSPLGESIYHEIDELFASEPVNITTDLYLIVQDDQSGKNSDENTINDESSSLGIEACITSYPSVSSTNSICQKELSTEKQDSDDEMTTLLVDGLISDIYKGLVVNSDDDSDNETVLKSTHKEGYLNSYNALSTTREKQDYE